MLAFTLNDFRCSYYDVNSSWISWIYIDKAYYFQLNFSKMAINKNNGDRNILIQQKFPIRFQCINQFSDSNHRSLMLCYVTRSQHMYWLIHSWPCCSYLLPLSHHAMGKINSLWSSDARRWQRSGSTLAQVMACCLIASSHYLNQCWLIISKVQWHSSECNFARDTSATSNWN